MIQTALARSAKKSAYGMKSRIPSTSAGHPSHFDPAARLQHDETDGTGASDERYGGEHPTLPTTVDVGRSAVDDRMA